MMGKFGVGGEGDVLWVEVVPGTVVIMSLLCNVWCYRVNVGAASIGINLELSRGSLSIVSVGQKCP